MCLHLEQSLSCDTGSLFRQVLHRRSFSVEIELFSGATEGTEATNDVADVEDDDDDCVPQVTGDELEESSLRGHSSRAEDD